MTPEQRVNRLLDSITPKEPEPPYGFEESAKAWGAAVTSVHTFAERIVAEIRAAETQAWNAALEEAAKVVKAHSGHSGKPRDICRSILAELRALKSQASGKGEE